MTDPADPALAALIARIAAGEAIDVDSIPATLRGTPSLERLLGLARVTAALDREFDEARDANQGRRIGPWKLTHRLGSGGMGDVWLGERVDDVVEQRVAVKCVRSASRDFSDRLLAERRILARLEHPNIARFIDAGLDQEGQPWLALEYVEGEPITDWCKRRVTPLRERLGLFAKVCAAVEHAHRHLVVHRDLKPGNVLVNTEGEPKLLDFGIAKLLDGGEDEPTAGALTPSYAAPEQLRGEPVSTATDVYALGLLLFRLLAGALPITRASGNPTAVLQRLDEEETQRPSRRVLDADPAPPYAPSDLAGDLDAIVAQAIRAKADARYGSVAELSADVERYLQARPVRARAPTRRYRFARFARRNRLPLALGTIAVIALIAGAAVALHQAQRAGREAASAQRELGRAEHVSTFLTSLFSEQDPLRRAGTVQASPQRLVADAVARVERELADDPLTMARLLRVLGEAQVNLDALPAARRTLERAAIHADSGGDALLGAEITAATAALDVRELHYDDAEDRFARALAMVTASHGADSVEAALIESRQAQSRVALARFKDAAAGAEHAHRVLTQQLGPNRPETIEALITVGIIQEQQRDGAAAQASMRAAIAAIDATFGAGNARSLVPLQTLGELQRQARDIAGARTSLQHGIDIARVQFGDRGAALSRLLLRLGGVERDAGDLVRALALLDEAEQALAGVTDDNVLGQLLNTRGSVLVDSGDGARAEADFRQSLALRDKAGGPRPGLYWFTQAQLGAALALQGRLREAHALQAEAASELVALIGPDGYQNALIAVRRAHTYELQKDFGGAAAQWREAVRLIEKTYGPEHGGSLDWRIRLAQVLAETREGRAEATQVADELLARWPDKAEVEAMLPPLVLLRCRLHPDRTAAATLARATLARPGLAATDEQRASLQAFAAQ